MPATLDEVIEAIQHIMNASQKENARYGYFASLYLKMTRAVKEGIANGRFDDGARMNRLCVIFAGRYLEAFEIWRAGKTPTRSWLQALEETKKSDNSVIQHLLSGINAHVNLDLGIAAAMVCPGPLIGGLEKDFNTINDVIASLVDEVQEKLEKISLPMRWLDRIGQNQDEAIANFCMGIARRAAWKVALELAALVPEDQKPYIGQLDQKTARFGKMIIHPGLLANLLLKPVKWYEPGSPQKILLILNS